MLNCQNYQKEVCYYVVLNEIIMYIRMYIVDSKHLLLINIMSVDYVNNDKIYTQ